LSRATLFRFSATRILVVSRIAAGSSSCQATGLSSSDLLKNYIIIEHEESELFPRYYLTMVDDGRDSCVFVADAGCSVYQHRPGACRMYPMGRGVTRKDKGSEEYFVLLREPHCLGFAEQTVQTIESYSKSQELETYNRFNDMLAEIQQHQRIRNGMKLSAAQISAYHCALYDIDTFRQKLAGSRNTPETGAIETLDDEALLACSFRWLKNTLFGPADETLQVLEKSGRFQLRCSN
jgi:Fe-S-cluster containining protein